MPDSSPPPDLSRLQTWSEARRLTALFAAPRLVACGVIGLGLASAIAETLSIGMAVLLLFALLQNDVELDNLDGLLARIHIWINELFGASSALIPTIFVMLLLLAAALAYANNAASGIILNRVAERVRNVVHERLITVGYIYLQQRDHGALVHTLANESWTVADAFYSMTRVAVNLAAAAVFIIGILALSWQLGLAALAGGGFAFVMLRFISRPIHRLGLQTLEANQVLTERMLVSINGMRTLRIYALERFLLSRFSQASSRVRQRATRAELFKAATGPLNQITGIGILVLMVLVGNWAQIDIATTIAAVLLLFRLQPYLLDMEEHRMALANISASLREVRRTVEIDGKPWPRQGKKMFPGLTQSLTFENVAFTHDPRKAPSLQDISFTIKRGQRTLLLGPSGSGKSTVLNLILRLYEPDEGRILVDGVDLADFTRESWLERLAIAGQDVELLEGTVMDNLVLGGREVAEETVRETLALVEILADLDELPDGLHTHIGAGGLSFSGGQRQRLGLARALLRDPEILLLDEAMNALEPALESRIRARIEQRLAGRTIISVSHRSDAVHHADDVIRLDHGRIDPSASLARETQTVALN